VTLELATGRFQNRSGNFGEYKNVLDFLGIEPVFLSAPASSVDIILTTVSGHKGLGNFIFLNTVSFLPHQEFILMVSSVYCGLAGS
jgi:hypothetical protein